MTFDICVVNDDQEPQPGRKVTAFVGPSHIFGIGGPVGGQIVESTDEDGHATFEPDG